MFELADTEDFSQNFTRNTLASSWVKQEDDRISCDCRQGYFLHEFCYDNQQQQKGGMNKQRSKDKDKNKPLNKKDKEKLRERHRRELEEAKIEQQKEVARQQLEVLKQTGIVNAYEQFLRSICKNGLPEPSNVYQFAAQFVLKYEKKMREKQMKRQQILEYNSEALKSNKDDSIAESITKGKSRSKH